MCCSFTQRHVTRAMLMVLLSSIFFNRAEASHLMGGEITWECINSGANAGKYVFHLVLYRDCNGASLTGGQSITIVNYNPDTVITMYEHSVMDISPACDDTISFNRENCGAGPPYSGHGGTGLGAVQKSTFISDTITLVGTPPSSGWIFVWKTCCRNSAIDNFPQPGASSITLRSVMYPYIPPGDTVALAASPCYDNAPQFGEDPAVIMCTGDTMNYNPMSSDPDRDSIRFSIGDPLTDWSSASGWTYDPSSPAAWQNPEPWFPNGGYPKNNLYLPNTSINSNNSSATLDSITGEILVKNFTSGSFVTVVRMDSWRCGQLIASVYRDVQIIYRSCQTSLQGVAIDNAPPNLNILNLGGTSLTKVGPWTWHDTVPAGSLIDFQILGLDTDTVNSGNLYCGSTSPCPQILAMTASGAWFGEDYISDSTGCPNPPCAILDNSIPIIDTAGIVGQFTWQTSCIHIDTAAACGLGNRYTFYFKIRDNMCPAPGTRYATVIIDLIPGSIAPDLSCVSELSNGDHYLSWQLPLGSSSMFQTLYIYGGSNPNGSFNLIDSVLNPQTISYIHQSPGATSYYFVRMKEGCNTSISHHSDTVTFTGSIDSIQACDSYTWIDGVTYTVSNSSATHTMLSSLGCDSVVQLNLDLNYSSSGIHQVTACDQYTWINGTNYSSSNNTATHTILNNVGCDSVVSLDLTILNSSSTTISRQVCAPYFAPNGQILQQSGNYQVVISNSDGCDSIINIDLSIDSLDAQEICLVSADSSTGDFNIVIWDKPSNILLVDSFLIFREIGLNTYGHIGSVFRDSLSIFYDYTANPNGTSYKYKLGMLDTCGNYSDLGAYHSSVHLQYFGNGVFQWTLYGIEGQANPVFSYNFYRDNSGSGNFSLIHVIPGGNNTFTDVDYVNYPNAVYRVGVEFVGNISCTPAKRSMTEVFSNHYELNPSSINDRSGKGLVIYPNPTSGLVSHSPKQELSYAVQDVYGKVLLKGTTQDILDIGECSGGVYLIRYYKDQELIKTFRVIKLD